MLDRVTGWKRSWSELDHTEKVKAIQEVWAVGDSASKLTAKIARNVSGKSPSRNAVIGIYVRNPSLKLSHPLEGAPTNESHRKRATERRKRGKARALEASGTLMLEADAPHKAARVWITPEAQAFDAERALLEIPLDQNLTRCHCHWPVNAPEPGEKFFFCGAVVEDPDRNYCDHHYDRSRGQRAKKRIKKRKSIRLIR